MAKSPETYVALLRGVNVGGNNKVPMKELAALCEAEGCREVRTFIASGNVVFRSGKAAATLPALLERAIARHFELSIPVIVRTGRELAAVLERNPFLARGTSPDAAYVMFMADAPSKAAIASLDPQRSPPDEFAVIGREIFLHLPNGGAKTKLASTYFDKQLKTITTARNWRTVTSLAGLAA